MLFTWEQWRGKRSPRADFGFWSRGAHPSRPPGASAGYRGRGSGGGDWEKGSGDGGLEALRRPAGRICVSRSKRDLGALSAGGGSRPRLLAEIELYFEEINQSAGNKNGSRGLGRVVTSPTRVVRAGGGDLGPRRGPFSHLSSFPGLPEGRSTLLTPLLPHTRPRSPAGPFPHLLLPSSKKSLVPEPVYAVALPLPAPTRVPPPAIATATTSVPLNRFLLHVNTYSR